MLKVKEISGYVELESSDYKLIIEDISFKVDVNQTLGIFGASGSGKSFTASSILGLVPYPGLVKGEIWFYDENLIENISEYCKIDIKNDKTRIKKDINWNKEYESKMKKIRGRKIALIPQEASSALCPFKNIKDQIKKAYEIGSGEKSSDDQIVCKILSLIKMEGYEEYFPHELSGGACQRALFGIILALDPNLLIADEFTTGLDPILKRDIVKLIKDFIKNETIFDEKERGLIIISHDLGIIQELSDDIIIIGSGRLIETKTKTSLMASVNPYTRKLLDDADVKGFINTKLSHKSTDKNELIMEIRGLNFSYPQKKSKKIRVPFAISDVSLDLKKNYIHGLIGESTCGKTTLGKLITMSIWNISSGYIKFYGQEFKNNDKSIFEYSRKEIKKYHKAVQMIYQNPDASLNPGMKIKDIIEESIKIGEGKLEKKDIEERISSYLDMMGLDKESARNYPDNFSGGEKRRISIIRTLAIKPEFVIADEPFSSLDASIRNEILNIFLKDAEDRKATYLFIMHDIDIAKYACEIIAVMLQGRIVEFGETDEILFERRYNSSKARHPYTDLLISAHNFSYSKYWVIENLDRPYYLNGCIFRSYCCVYKKLNDSQKSNCEDVIPLLIGSENHKIACHFPC